MPIASNEEVITNGCSYEYYLSYVRYRDNFENLWRMKQAVRSSIREWLLTMQTIVIPSTEVAAGCAGELLENSIKYSIHDSQSYLLLYFTDTHLVIETGNRAEEEDLETARKIVAQISSKERPLEELYLEQVRKAVGSKESRIGLYKISLESKGTLEFITTSENPTFGRFRIRMSFKKKSERDGIEHALDET